MDILVIDPEHAITPATEPVLRSQGHRTLVATDRTHALTRAMTETPDAVVLRGDGRAGETTHLCQRFKANPLISSIPLVLVEDTPPPAWLLASLPVDAFTHPPFDPTELLHHLDFLAPVTSDSGTDDDLTSYPRRRFILGEVERRLRAGELCGVGLLTLREPDAYRQDFGRAITDQFVVLVSVILRRRAAPGSPVSIGYLEDGAFLLLGAPTAIHHLLAQTIRDFEHLVPAHDQMDTHFGNQGSKTGPLTWVRLEGAVCLVESDRFDNVLQIGFVLAETLAAGQEAVRPANSEPLISEPGQLVAD